MFDSAMPIIAEEIKAQTVLVLLYFIGESFPEYGKLCLIDKAFKHGILNPLSEILTYLGDSSQSSLSIV
jgi:hypothetical protein